MSNNVCPKLTTHQVETLIKLVEAQTNFGIEYIKGANLFDIESALKSTMLEESTGLHDLHSGNLNFSFFYKGDRVGGIKILRETGGFGLKEALDIIKKARPVSVGQYQGWNQLVFNNSTYNFFDYLTEAGRKLVLKSSSVEIFTKLGITEVIG